MGRRHGASGLYVDQQFFRSGDRRVRNRLDRQLFRSAELMDDDALRNH